MQPESLMRNNFADLFFLYIEFTLSSLFMHYFSVTDFIMSHAMMPRNDCLMLAEMELNLIASKKLKKWHVTFVSMICKATKE